MAGRRYAAALSEHPLAAEAIGEVVGEVLDRAGSAPDLAVLFCSAPHHEFLREMTAAVHTLLDPASFLAATSRTVLGGRRHVEGAPALALWASWCGPVDVRAVTDASSVGAIAGTRSAILLTHAASCRPEPIVDTLHDAGVAVCGGEVAGASDGAGLVVGHELLRTGGALVLFESESVIGPVVADTGRAVGPEFTVTESTGRHVVGLDGVAAAPVVEHAIGRLAPPERALLKAGVDVLLTDETGRRQIGSLRGIDRAAGVVALDDAPRLGDRLRLMARHPSDALDGLRDALVGITAGGALAFVDETRTEKFFGRSDADAEEIVDVLDTTAVAGIGTSRQFAPLAAKNQLHRRTCAVLTLAR